MKRGRGEDTSFPAALVIGQSSQALNANLDTWNGLQICFFFLRYI